MQHDRKPQARRESVKRHPGIYSRIGANGKKRYEVTWVEPATGKRRWETVEGNLEEAQAKLDDYRSKVRRGERVAPNRATLNEVADLWLAAQTELRPRTRERYESNLDLHIRPRLGRRRIGSITEDDVTTLIAELREGVYYEQVAGRIVNKQRKTGYAAWTIRGILVALSRVFAFGVRRGYLTVNPVSRLERGERPRVARRERRVLTSDEIAALLGAALPGYRTLLAIAVYTGLRQSELLGLTWHDVDFETGVVRVRRQLDRSRGYVEPKTPQAVRDVVLAPALARLLKQHREAALSRGLAKLTDPVFANAAGRPFEHRNVQSRGFDKAAERSRLNVNGNGRRKASFHDLRHTFASLLIAQGADVVHVSRQLGHADPAITLKVYADEFAAADHADRTRALLDAAVGHVLETGERKTWRTTASTGPAAAVQRWQTRD